jgi:hypothetical protein
MDLFCSKRISIQENDNIYFFKDYLNFVVENEINDLQKFGLVKPKLYIFDENRHITVLEWFSNDWNSALSRFKELLKDYSSLEDILGYSITWPSSKGTMNIIIKYSDEYEETYINQAYIYKFEKVADLFMGQPLKKATIRKEFFQLI